jgi:hypothetical protein
MSQPGGVCFDCRALALRVFQALMAISLARAERSSGVKPAHASAPPFFPPMEPCLRKYSREMSSAGAFFFIAVPG